MLLEHKESCSAKTYSSVTKTTSAPEWTNLNTTGVISVENMFAVRWLFFQMMGDQTKFRAVFYATYQIICFKSLFILDTKQQYPFYCSLDHGARFTLVIFTAVWTKMQRRRDDKQLWENIPVRLGWPGRGVICGSTHVGRDTLTRWDHSWLAPTKTFFKFENLLIVTNRF